MIQKFYFLTIFNFALLPLFAQPVIDNKLTKTNIYVCDIDAYDSPDYTLPLKNWKLLTGDNMNNFNNNPVWSWKDKENVLYISSSRDGKQADSYSLDIDTGTRRRLTFTENENELVTRPMHDYAHATALTTEKSQIQRVHKFPIDGQAAPIIFGGDLTMIGSFIWLNLTTWAAFLTENNNVVTIDAESGNIRRVSAQCGTNLQINTRGDLIFLYKKNEVEGQIKLYDRMTEKNRTLCNTLQGSVENFTVLPDNSIICAKNSKLYRIFPAVSPEWHVINDLQDVGIHHISQITCNKNGKLAIVALD